MSKIVSAVNRTGKETIEEFPFPEIGEGEAVEFNWRRRYLRFACCDCGLVHRIRFAIIGDTLRMRAYRDHEGTAYYRGGEEEGEK